MATISTFYPAFKSGKSISATATSARVALGTQTGSIVPTNTGTELCYVCFGDENVEATAADYPLIGGTQVSLGRDPRATHAAVICPGGTSTVLLISGEGQ